jgi:hypothetical protein
MRDHRRQQRFKGHLSRRQGGEREFDIFGDHGRPFPVHVKTGAAAYATAGTAAAAWRKDGLWAPGSSDRSGQIHTTANNEIVALASFQGALASMPCGSARRSGYNK